MTDVVNPNLHPTYAALVSAFGTFSAGPAELRAAVAAVVNRHRPVTGHPGSSFIVCVECGALAWPPPVDTSAAWSDVVYPCATIADIAQKLRIPVERDWPTSTPTEKPMADRTNRPDPSIIVSMPGLTISKGPFGFLVRQGERLTLEDAVTQAIGEASSCWEQLRSAGLFQSDRAKEIVDRLLAAIRSGTLVDEDTAPEADKDAQVRELVTLLAPHVRATSGGPVLAAEQLYAAGWRKVAAPITATGG